MGYQVCEHDSVLQGWVMRLPLREQGTLLTAVRGCDLAPKGDSHLASPERQLVAFIRWCFMNAADPREIDAQDGCWFRSTPPAALRPSVFMHYPLHWYSHVMHALEVIGYRHPDPETGASALGVYLQLVRALHLQPEPREMFERRLSEDRILSGTVVS